MLKRKHKKRYMTLIQAINPKTGKIDTFMGPNVIAYSKREANNFCQNNGLGYCVIGDEIIDEINISDNLNLLGMKYATFTVLDKEIIL